MTTAVASITAAAEIDRPVTTTFDAWSSSPRIPTFLGGAAEERPTDVAQVDWVSLIEGRADHFTATVDERVPGQRITWQGQGRPHAGAVIFEAIDGERSRVSIELDWHPDTDDGLADRLILRRQLQDELEAFRHDLATSAPTGPPPPSTPAPSTSASPRPATSTDPAPAGNRGKGADSPTGIPAAGWKDILKRTVKQLKTDNVSLIAAGAAFYVFLALVPALIAVISVYGLVADPADVGRQLGTVLAALPADAAEIIRTQVTAITAEGETGLGLGLAVSVALALFGASKGMLALVTALNIAYDEDETRGFVRLRVLALGLTVVVAVGAVVAVGGMVLIRNVAERLGTFGSVAVSIVRWPVLAALVIAALAALFRFAPDRKPVAWRWVTPGAILATVLSVLGSIAFSVYVANFGTYNQTYGLLGGVVVLLLWLLLTSYAIVFGAELDREVEQQRAGATGGHR